MFQVEQITSLNELELEVYHYIMDHRLLVKDMKIRDLADAAHVSTTTVIRFCKKMDCSGYAEFKVKYKMYLGKKNEKITQNNVHFIKDFITKLEQGEYEEKINAVSTLIERCNKVIFVGIGTSGSLGGYGARYFSNLGKFAQVIDDPFFPIPHGYYNDAVVVILSVSGETREIVSLANNFKESAAALVSITNTECSTIAKMSDISLTYYMPLEMFENQINLTTQVPVICLIEHLAKKIHLLMEEKET